tara:strand:+ start:5649 stop:5993 length:345 start_codon:yes stop_codon:yes gene_type:complete
MSSQLFKNQIPSNILFKFLEKHSYNDGKFYVFTKTSYKQAIYHNSIAHFCEELIHYYHKSKQYYVQRKMSYSKLITIIRQLCKANNISYTSRIIYRESDYEIQYYISIPENNLS